MVVAEEDDGVSAWSAAVAIVVSSCNDDSINSVAQFSEDCPTSWALRRCWVSPTGCERSAGQDKPTWPATVISSGEYGSKSNIKGTNEMDYSGR